MRVALLVLQALTNRSARVVTTAWEQEQACCQLKSMSNKILQEEN
jgi:hypothetical protein